MCVTETKPKPKTETPNDHHRAINGNGNGVTNNNNGSNHSLHNDDVVIHLDYGDPKLLYPYWKSVDDECSVTIKASDLLSYFVNPNEGEFAFHVPGFTEAVRRVHRVVGNAVTEGRYIIGGTGSSQLFIYALRALASTVNSSNNTNKKRIPVVCAKPYYSLYGEAIEEEKSEMYEWGGDANEFKEEGGPYIEVVTFPNNPDGGRRKPVAKREGGLLIHDLAYYWPQYTPITEAADYDIMLFTMSKATGHAGSRVGWAIVKDPKIASMMMKQVSTMSIGSCQEGQLRATKILQFTAESYELLLDDHKTKPTPVVRKSEKLFEYSHRVLDERWKKLRAVVERTGVFSLPDYPAEHCNFFGKLRHATPAFAWMECNRGGDAAKILTELKIKARTGTRFGLGVSGKFVRVSLLGCDDTFDLFLERLSRLTN